VSVVISSSGSVCVASVKSGIPSPSSSVSTLSPIPSPSVSVCSVGSSGKASVASGVPSPSSSVSKESTVPSLSVSVLSYNISHSTSSSLHSSCVPFIDMLTCLSLGSYPAITDLGLSIERLSLKKSIIPKSDI